MYIYKNFDNYSQLFDEVFQELNSYTRQASHDMKDHGDYFAASVAVPGANREDIKITNQENKLTVSYNPEEKNEFCAPFSRTWKFTGVDFDKVSAGYTNGVLVVSVPKSKKPEPSVRTIKVN